MEAEEEKESVMSPLEYASASSSPLATKCQNSLEFNVPNSLTSKRLRPFLPTENTKTYTLCNHRPRHRPRHHNTSPSYCLYADTSHPCSTNCRHRQRTSVGHHPRKTAARRLKSTKGKRLHLGSPHLKSHYLGVAYSTIKGNRRAGVKRVGMQRCKDY